MEAECRGKFVGPMPPANFLKAFLGNDVLTQGCANDKFELIEESRVHLQKAQTCGTEVAMYGALISGLKDYCPELKIEDTHLDGHESEWARTATEVKPDLTAYERDAELERPLDLAKAEVVVEVKVKGTADPFVDN
ncbi:hypothetical protein MPER_01829, partial [Moniliophthora perniciosa FA553]